MLNNKREEVPFITYSGLLCTYCSSSLIHRVTLLGCTFCCWSPWFSFFPLSIVNLLRNLLLSNERNFIFFIHFCFSLRRCTISAQSQAVCRRSVWRKDGQTSTRCPQAALYHGGAHRGSGCSAYHQRGRRIIAPGEDNDRHWSSRHR